MNRYFSLVPIIGVVATITLQSHFVFALEGSEIPAKVKEFTVQIDGEATGSGTIIEHNGNTYTVLTCWHVVNIPGKYRVITPDRETHEVTEIKNIPNVDLATVQFTSSKTYQTAELGDSSTATIGKNIYVAGYPDSNSFEGIPEGTYFFLDAKVASQLSKGKQGYTIVHDNPATPGSSGGGIFDTNGRLIGINGRATVEGEIGKAYGIGIPLQIYLATRTDLKIPANVAVTQDIVSIGIQKLKKKDYQGAIAEFNKALEADTNNIEAYYSRGAAFFILKDYEAAIADFNQFLHLNPNNHFAYFYRGYIRAEKGDYQGAIADYNQAIQIYPNFNTAYTNRGFAYSKLGDSQNAIADYTQAIELNPESATAYHNRGLVFGRDLGDYQKALSDFTKAIKLAPEDVQVYVDRGNVYKLLGEIESAIDDYSQAISLNPQYADAHYNRGIAYSQQNQPEKALGDLQRAATLFEAQGDDANYQRALDRIREIQGI
jgi:tetratricopeptide (TPR) repeat protein